MLTPTGQVNHSAGAPRRAATEISEVRVRVLHLNAGNLYGGVETLQTTLAGLRDLCPGMEQHFGICYEGRASRELIETGAPVHLLGSARISRPWTVWRARRRLGELLQREPFDAVICHMSWPWVVFGATLRAAGPKVALWAHGFPEQDTWLDRMARWKTPDLVLANSRFTAGTVREQFPNVPMRLIYYPVAPVDSRAAEQWRTRVRLERGVADNTTVILQAGRLEPWKGHLVHLQALSRLRCTQPWVCWIAGGPQTPEQEEYLQGLKATVHELGLDGRVQFLGPRTDVPQLMAASDIFCQPNQGPEPFGLVYVEALWVGRPVIGAASGGALDIVDDSCGLLAEPGNPESLAEALGSLVQSPELRARLGAGGVARARKLCDPATQMNGLRELLLEAVGEKSS
jgi:glycosyltransferase involved in cell wall biosynthesis